MADALKQKKLSDYELFFDHFLVDHFGQRGGRRCAIRVWRRRGGGLAKRGLDVVERLALRDHGLDLVVLVLNEIELFLHVGLGHHVAVAGQVGIGIETEHAFGIFDPAGGGAMLFQVNQRVGAVGDQQVAAEDDFLVGEIHDGIAAGVRPAPSGKGEYERRRWSAYRSCRRSS